ncbi:superfamily II DNA or RNA helicase/HKD family nuclease [Planomicrobium stackebrandtii]|uniref:Superfamily II DNA or RNA helicase/HKD family nuclease n=1 Tax=Planomicrobium stackebrandtii TaxID=253160 RepID=A0ABU0GX58_9BACL|nr:DEAD/DEAH box helicase [Planomicrobium stackebrandtii]MDQ0429519.1 superfamily II DNA or RNA helicase/HKD family nuclease [Planomicrobium stackebrandtii]
MNLLQSLEDSIYKGFIDQTKPSGERFKPTLLINNTKTNETVLNSITEELDSCQSFLFSVAFVTESGLATLKTHLSDLQQKGIKGRILTSTFLNFNQPKVFKELMKINNVEVRLSSMKGFHSKGYIFSHDTHQTLIVGSSNLTAQALKVNYEWNVKLSSHENGEFVSHFYHQFEEVWESAQPLTEQWITSYEQSYVPMEYRKELTNVAEFPEVYTENPLEESINIKPNKMQKAALQEIQAVRESGNDKGLVISATGTGKTYLSAFDVREFAPKRMLFIVHREQILQKAKADFIRILGGVEKDFGILSGNLRETDARYLFATIQTISKEETLRQLDPQAFDYILIDEVHKAGAKSYQRVIEHFQPKFLMGMTATPERTDDFNIYELFDYNVAYEIRLQEALEEDMLCPFHYFGVTDVEYEEGVIDEATVFSKLITEERVDHLLQKVYYYGHSGDKVRGLMFCSRKEEAIKLSEELNRRGLKTVALTGQNSQEERILQVERLENGVIDYILTVDIFNEGIDIPSVNQVVMLKQTQSSIIFIQQLGRGLRKHGSKEFVTIIDFIGNYKNNYLIPIALSGERSQNKDNIRRRMKDTSYIKGISTVNFEEIAKNRVFSAIKKSNLSDMKILREAYIELKNRIGHIPQLQDFIHHNSIDPLVIVQKYTTYHQFLLKLKEIDPLVNAYEEQVLTMLSLEILNGKRLHEILLLELLLKKEKVTMDTYEQYIQSYNCSFDSETLASVQRIMDLSFFNQGSRKKYGTTPLVDFGIDGIEFNEEIQESLEQNSSFQAMLLDIVISAKELNKNYRCDKPLTLYKKYTRKDACRLLNWTSDESSTIYGYKTKHGTCPIFVTYHKNDEVESSVAYTEGFISPEIFTWSTRSNRTLASAEVKTIIGAAESNIDLHLFIKKDDDEGGDFYYLGQALPDKSSVEQALMKDKNLKDIPVVHMNLALENMVEGKLYHYIASEEN